MKKYLALVLALVMILGVLSSCNTPADPVDTTVADTTASDTTAADTTTTVADTTTGEPEKEADKLKIASNGNLLINDFDTGIKAIKDNGSSSLFRLNPETVALEASVDGVDWSKIEMENCPVNKTEKGNWSIGDIDLGVAAVTEEGAATVISVNPISYYLQASVDNGATWAGVDFRVDSTVVNEYNYPMDTIVPADGTIRESDNNYIKSTSYRGAFLYIEDSVFDTVTITRGSGTTSVDYAFLAAKPQVFYHASKFPNGHTPTYAAGYTRVVTSTDETITLKVPDNARYLYIYYNSNEISYLPEAIKLSKSGNAPADDSNSIRIATWNIGHFALGEKNNTILTEKQKEEKLAEYTDYIYNCINADVIALNEYCTKFTTQSLAKTTVFSKYSTQFEGPKRQYSRNAIFANANVTNIQLCEYECNKTANMESPYGIQASNYYYLTADLAINGQTVKLVSTHLAFYAGNSSNPPEICKDQMRELVEVYKSYDKVVLMGDWNAYFSDFSVFTDAGYSLANTDSNLSTYSSSIDPLDNIIYKGVTVSDFGLAGCTLSDHYAIYCTITVE
ncbi:MAG: hypothetical protein IKB47_01365 [Clostridia bacterium]|nr:hypothetical protein [Clostridia bacterium]